MKPSTTVGLFARSPRRRGRLLWTLLLGFVYLAAQPLALAASGSDCPMKASSGGMHDPGADKGSDHHAAPSPTDPAAGCGQGSTHDGGNCAHDCASAAAVTTDDPDSAFGIGADGWVSAEPSSAPSHSTSPPLPPPLFRPLPA